jgi:hypothetical protein
MYPSGRTVVRMNQKTSFASGSFVNRLRGIEIDRLLRSQLHGNQYRQRYDP